MEKILRDTANFSTPCMYFSYTPCYCIRMTDRSNQKGIWRSDGWAELPYFLAAARRGSLRAAAEELAVNHATVNSNLQRLEAHYAVRLFDRTPKGLALTSAGEDLLERALEAEQVIMSGRRRVGGRDKALAGKVHLNISSWNAYYILAKQLPRFHEEYPEIDLRITVSDKIEILSNSDIDVTWRIAWRVDEDVVGRKVYDYHAAIIASESYLEKHWAARGPDGQGLHWVGKSTLWPNPKLERLNLFPAAKRTYSIEDPILINELLVAGMGMAIMPLPTVQVLPGLTVVPGTPIERDRTCWVLLQSDLRHTARVRALVEFLADTARAFSRREAEIIAQHGTGAS